ncbi:MAG: homoserine dehydrogenase [Demequinaceae bacterium]|nr:homoserine dehydrogenase [Demequinaceae bacterium]
MADAPPSVKIALLGAGTVGSEVARLLIDHKDDLAQRIGAMPEVVGIATLEPDDEALTGLPRDLITTDAAALIPKADIVVELIGGLEPARTFVLDALQSGKAVVTANKALLAAHGPEIYEAADANGSDLYFEAAVGGAIPIIRPVRESLAGDRIQRILGIVNGTTNYVLDRMTTAHLDYEVALKEAQEAGFAEADPTADVEGYDAASKIAILASLAFHMRVSLDDVYREGITEITPHDVAAAAESGHVIKLLGIAQRTDAGVTVRVHPALVPLTHPLANVGGAYNAVFIEAEAAGELMFYGKGAGGVPTASAVLGDIVSVARHRALGGKGPRESNYVSLPVLPIASSRTRFQIRLEVADRPGVLAKVAAILGAHDVSIETVRQPPSGGGDGRAHLVIATHEAVESDLSATVEEIRACDVVHAVLSVLRIEGE